MPIYEYRCPNGHVFERFQRMTDPAPDACEVCNAAPVELVLYPVAIHYKGSGFYSTDYGKGAKKKEGAAAGASDGSSTTSGGEAKSESKGETKTESAKPAETKSST